MWAITIILALIYTIAGMYFFLSCGLQLSKVADQNGSCEHTFLKGRRFCLDCEICTSLLHVFFKNGSELIACAFLSSF